MIIGTLLDTDLYTGGNPSATMGPVTGLGEYTNANYFSASSGTKAGRGAVLGLTASLSTLNTR